MIIADQARILRVSLLAGAVSIAGFSLAGCIASPTYGTDKTANAQLLEDMTGMLAMTPKRGTAIDYKPRPKLVTPETMAVLPQPQDSVTTASNSAWPESPEQRLARIRQDATDNQDNPGYRPNVIYDASAQNGSWDTNDPNINMSDRERRAEFKRRLAETREGSPNSRKFLSEPPTDYRQPAATAPVGDVGESEWKKDRKARRGGGTDSADL